MQRFYKARNTLGWAFIALMIFAFMPFGVAEIEWKAAGAEDMPVELATFDPGDMVMVTINSGGDTLFEGDSLVVSHEFRTFHSNIDWIHSLAIHYAGGDSAGIDSCIVRLSADGTNFFNYGSAILTGAPSDTALTVSIPMAKAVRFTFYTLRADKDTTILSGYYIYR